jgi:hypothetical protein
MAAHPEEVPATIVETFLADHRRLEDSLTRVLIALEAVDPERAAAEWADFDREMTAHLDAEDVHLIPVLMAVRPRDAQSLLHEHRHLRRRVVELGGAARKGLVRSEALRGFVDELCAHARRETTTLYDWAEDALSDEERNTALKGVRPKSRPPPK